jgi:hypothetical protein
MEQCFTYWILLSFVDLGLNFVSTILSQPNLINAKTKDTFVTRPTSIFFVISNLHWEMGDLRER